MKNRKPKGSTLNSASSITKQKLNAVNLRCAYTDQEGVCIPVDQATPVVRPDEKQILPMGANYDPPFSYTLTDSAPCNKLTAMIDTTKNQMANMSLEPEQYNVYQAWLSYAEQLHETKCAVVAQDPVTASPAPVDQPVIKPAPVTTVEDTVEETLIVPVKQMPAEIEPVNTVSVPEKNETVTIDDDLSVKKNDALPIEQNLQPQADDKITAIQTLSTPPATPFPMGMGSGGSGASEPETMQPDKKKNWFWMVVAATGLTGLILFKRKP